MDQSTRSALSGLDALVQIAIEKKARQPDEFTAEEFHARLKGTAGERTIASIRSTLYRMTSDGSLTCRKLSLNGTIMNLYRYGAA